MKSVEILVPLATYAPWNLRTGLPGRTSELTNFRGTYIPFSKTEQERKDNGDPRPSIESLYASREEYLDRVTEATGYLVDERFLLPEDAPAAKARAALYWDWIFEN